jgi:enamine deaminase RidA (YjgF/YER057c/UK114 family)
MDIRRIAPGTRMSGAVVAGGLVFTSGQVDAQGAGVTAQTQAILAKIDALLAQAGTDKSRLVWASIWLADIAAFDEMNAVWDAWIDPAAPPARATVESTLAKPAYRVEIAVVAATGAG